MAGFEVALAEKLKENELALPQGFNQARFVQNILALHQSNENLRDWVSKHGADGGRYVCRWGLSCQMNF